MNHFDVGLVDLDFEKFTDSELGDNSVMGPSGNSTIGTATLSAETANPISGTKSMKIVTTSGNNGSYPRFYLGSKSKMVPFPKLGERYRLTFDTKLISGNITINNISFRDGSDTPPSFLKFADDELVLTTETQSHTFEATITDLTSVTNSIFWSIKGSTTAGTFLIDNIKLKRIGVNGYVTVLYDQTGRETPSDAIQTNAALQPQIVRGGSLIKSGGHPAWEYADVVPQHNLEIIGMSDMTPDLFFVSEIADATEVIIPTSLASSYYGIVSQNGNTTDGNQGPYGSAGLIVNGTQINGAGGGEPNRQEVYNAVVGRKLVYHRSASTASWPKVAIGHYNSSNSAANIVNTKFSELIWYNSEQSADNQSGINSNINSHYNIYS